MSITIDGKVYDESKFSVGLRNRIVARQEIEQSKVRHDIELEKIAVLTEFYNKKIVEMMKKEKVQPIENGSDS